MKRSVYIAAVVAGAGLLFSSVILAGNLQSIPFWQKQAGVWQSENTYLDGNFEYRIKAYRSLVVVSLTEQTLIIREIKFYPAGSFNGAAVGLDIPADHAVQLIQVTEASAMSDQGVVEFNQVPTQNGSSVTRITPLSSDSGLMTISNRHSGVESYRAWITLPTENTRHVINLGLHTQTSDTLQAGAIRGVSIFHGRRLENDAVPEAIARSQQDYGIATIVHYSDGKFTIEAP